MAAIDNLINVTITQSTAAVSQANFGVPLILGSSQPGWATGDLVHTYSDVAGLLTDGFTTQSPEYIYAEALMSQTLQPAQFMVGRRATAATTVATALAAISAQNDGWYGLCATGLTDAEKVAVAGYIEAQRKIFITTSANVDIPTNATGDLASTMKATGYNRTALIYAVAGATQGVEAAWLGLMLPTTPGAASWAYQPLAGITGDNLSAQALAALYGSPVAGVAGKNVNVYAPVAGSNCTFPGMMTSGRYIDITIGVDWLQANQQLGVFSVLLNAQKVPYTDAGTAMLMSSVRSVMQQAVDNGLIDGKDADNPVTVNCASVSSVPASQRANRIAPTITFSGRLQGAMNSVKISGTVTV